MRLESESRLGLCGTFAWFETNEAREEKLFELLLVKFDDERFDDRSN